MAVSLPQDLELRCRVAAQLAGLSFGGWVERALHAATAPLSGGPSREAYLQARDRYESGATMTQAVQGIEVPARRASSSGIDASAVAAGVAEGLSDAQIAERLGCTAQTVERARRDLGVRLRKTPAARVEDATLLVMHREGLATCEIARRTGLTLGSARTRLSRLRLADNGRRK